jgi:hypothetical protein
MICNWLSSTNMVVLQYLLHQQLEVRAQKTFAKLKQGTVPSNLKAYTLPLDQKVTYTISTIMIFINIKETKSNSIGTYTF